MSADSCNKIVQITQGERKELSINILDSNGKAVDLTNVTNIQSVHPLASGYLIKQLENAGVAEVTDIQCVADVSQSLASKYFTYSTPTQDYAFWFSVDGNGTAPSLSQTFIREVAISENDIAGDVASALQAVMDLEAGISASVSTDTVTATNAALGSATDADANNTGFTITTTTDGEDVVVDSVEIIDVAGQVKVKLQDSETGNLKVENRATMYLAVDFPIGEGGRKIFKIQNAYDVCETSFTLS